MVKVNNKMLENIGEPLEKWMLAWLRLRHIPLIENSYELSLIWESD